MNVYLKSQTESRMALLYGVWLYAIWSLYVAFIYPLIATNNLLSEFFRVVIFLLPLYLMYRQFAKPNFQTLGINRNLLSGLLIGIVFSVLYLALVLPLTLTFRNQALNIETLSKVPIWAALSIAVVVEEVVFRGYFLVFFERYGKWTAIIASTVLFVLIHYPGWWLLDLQPSAYAWVQSSFSIFFLGVILSIIFLRYRSLLACIMVHATNNFIASIPV